MTLLFQTPGVARFTRQYFKSPPILQRVYCGFCGVEIARTTEGFKAPAVEAKVREHILASHPVRWRLTRKYRLAMLESKNIQAAA